GSLKNYENELNDVKYVPSDDFDVSCEADGILVGEMLSLNSMEVLKKKIIEKKINNSFILTRAAYYTDWDKIKKMKEFSLFNSLTFLTYDEAVLFADIPKKEECDEKYVNSMIFKLNSFGMANKLVITSVPVKDKGMVTVLSEYGEFDILDFDFTHENEYLPSLYLLSEMVKGKKLEESVININKMFDK
ncbi:MAG: hypothetical protein J6Q87_05275, partial [Clostridia bacterium]|nr:hypothetical protein [Clostridia bacterium]